MICRGPMLHSVITQFLASVEWGKLDYLVIDRRRAPASAAHSDPNRQVTGAVVVTTPSTVALRRRPQAIEMFRQVHVEVLGVVGKT